MSQYFWGVMTTLPVQKHREHEFAGKISGYSNLKCKTSDGWPGDPAITPG